MINSELFVKELFMDKKCFLFQYFEVAILGKIMTDVMF